MNKDRVLVTGAFGLVGSAVVAALADHGRQVVAADLDIPANRKRAQAFTVRPWGSGALGQSDIAD